MEITLDKKTPTHGNLKLTFGPTDYKDRIASKLKEYSKKANIKGFRPGKVPMGLIDKMYGKGIKIEEINTMVSESVQNYIKENKLDILGDPLPNKDEFQAIDWQNQSDFEFNYEIGLIPEIEVPLDEKTKFTQYKIEVDDKTLNKTLKNIQKQSGTNEEVEESAENHKLHGHLVNEAAEIDRHADIDLADFENTKDQKVFLGKKKGDVIEFDLAKLFSKDADMLVRVSGKKLDDAKKLKGNSSFTVEKIEKNTPAEMNQELFDKAIGKDKAKSEVEFKTEVKRIIQENQDKEAEAFLQREIQDYLLDKVKMQLPSEFLKRWLLLSNEGKLTQEQIESEFEHYERDLKWNIIKNKLQNKANLEVKHEEIVQSAQQMIAGQFGGALPPEQLAGFLEQFVDNYLKENNGQNYLNLHSRLLNDKVMNWAIDLVTKKEKKVTWDEFEKIVTK